MTSSGHYSHLSFTFDGIKFSEEYQWGQPVLQQCQALKFGNALFSSLLKLTKERSPWICKR